MVKSTSKTSTKETVTKQPTEEKPIQEKEELALETSSSSSDEEDEKDEDEIEGLATSDDEQSGTHKIKRLNPKKQANEKKSKDKKTLEEYSGIIYVSRLPHGFHEKELSKYFAQFGDLKEVRLARNKKTGNSRHYGFLEFVNKEDAMIAQESMNNYLLMGHLLQVRVLPKGAKIEKLYKYKKRVLVEKGITKPVKQLKDNMKQKHEERIKKLGKSGIEFKW
ncbi:BFH_HP2_G0045200.mRNA.1.CDS.1 [Saccharomyces cerevisiae]|nr:BFH_HP2_G0045200.mRNA.1.CDS.1 [Saccharomyces cerevisiae]CAI6734825.1 BFH_HP2_G0045200.mRNA.1.CDS.1 [Saccharomyces cerevisiae]CAI6747652.1 BFH_HP1_G0045620.mRNA.1.CDS.1 [Saccharomyces cerevisiae]CAI7309782.1 ASN_collapsed_G0046280.mRNA.1.CDS.1 [Saccharomyces cerevisiae]